MKLNREDIGLAVFGVFDGMTSLLGLLTALIVAHAQPRTILLTAAGLAVATAVSMAGGEFLGEEIRAGHVRRAVVMGLATFGGSLAPALPVVMAPGPGGIAFSLAAVLVLAHLIADVRARDNHLDPLRANLQTYAVLVAAAGLSIGMTLLLGGVAA